MNEKKIHSRIYDEYRKYDELCNKIRYRLRSNLNLLIDLNNKYTAKLYICENLHHIITFQFN